MNRRSFMSWAAASIAGVFLGKGIAQASEYRGDPITSSVSTKQMLGAFGLDSEGEAAASMDVDAWRSKVESEIARWRGNPDYVPTVPVRP